MGLKSPGEQNEEDLAHYGNSAESGQPGEAHSAEQMPSLQWSVLPPR